MTGKPQKYNLGHTLQKEFESFGFFEGTVISYNEENGLYKIKYEDGDLEDMDEADLDRYDAAGGPPPKGVNEENEEEEEEDDDLYTDDVKAKEDHTEEVKHKHKARAYPLEEKEYALVLAMEHRKEGTKNVNRATFIPALAKALDQSEEYARKLYASATSYVWKMQQKGITVSPQKRASPPKSSQGSLPSSNKKPKPEKPKPALPSFVMKGTLSYNEFCRVHIIRGVVEDKSAKFIKVQPPEQFELVRTLDRPEEDPKELPSSGKFHTANFDQEVHIRFMSKGIDKPNEYEVQGEGTSGDDAHFEITGTATLNEAAATAGVNVFDLVLKKQYLTAPKQPPPPPQPQSSEPVSTVGEQTNKELTKEPAVDPKIELKKDLLGLVRKIKRQKFAWPFLEPVDTKEVPDYLDKIKEPICLSTIEARIKKGEHYTTKEKLRPDLMLMASNCKLYNSDDPTSPYLECANNLEKFVGTLFVDP